MGKKESESDTGRTIYLFSMTFFLIIAGIIGSDFLVGLSLGILIGTILTIYLGRPPNEFIKKDGGKKK